MPGHLRDLDEVFEQMEYLEERETLENQTLDFLLPGRGHRYRIHCVRHFVDRQAVGEHNRSRAQKKRLKDLRERRFSSEESETAVQQSHTFSTKIRNIALLSSTPLNKAVFQPVFDFQFVSENETNLQKSIDARGLTPKRNVKELSNLYEKVRSCKSELDALELEKTENSKAFNAIKTKSKQIMSEESEDKVFQKIQEKGRDIRERLRSAIKNYHEGNDELVEGILQLPNILDPETPHIEKTLLRQNNAPYLVTPWTFRKHALNIVADLHPPCSSSQWSNPIPRLRSAPAELHLSTLAAEQLRLHGFSEAVTTDAMRKALFYSLTRDKNKLIRLGECNAKSGDSHSTYLTGSSSLPSLLLMYSQSIVKVHVPFPLRNFAMGCSDCKNNTGLTKHNPIVHCIVACRDKESMEIEFSSLSKFMEEFYTSKVGIQSFETQCVPDIELAPYESKKYVFITNKTESSSPRLIGEISLFGDHLSQRILCCYKDKDFRIKFIHFVYAKFFDITNFLREDDSIPETSINN